ncbi:MAG TPA: response regulator [Anaerolineaceae bacterium]|nr:response regulator [Anaerolineaceae bacterium]HQF45210.1 response regulator [Anaerolineaceae bacterium]HQH35061.1 response regulator [Anaerolineaceae bacterium]HQJ02372.1 response regulator [Anaerolineaceae bacterium]
MARVFFLDDDPLTLQLMEEVCRQMGHIASSDVSPDRALERVVVEQPDLVIVDCRMFEMDGMEWIGRVKENPMSGFIPVVMLSAYADRTLRERALAAGAVEYLLKPIRFEELEALIERLAPSQPPTDLA